jgi:hypothetical protein
MVLPSQLMEGNPGIDEMKRMNANRELITKIIEKIKHLKLSINDYKVDEDT